MILDPKVMFKGELVAKEMTLNLVSIINLNFMSKSPKKFKKKRYHKQFKINHLFKSKSIITKLEMKLLRPIKKQMILNLKCIKHLINHLKLN